MTLVDSNFFMYAPGRDHPHKRRATAFLEKVALGSVEAIIDAEVLQEILHRYRAIARWQEGRPVYDAARLLFPTCVPVTDAIMNVARSLMDDHPRLMARDAVHAAVELTHGLQF